MSQGMLIVDPEAGMFDVIKPTSATSIPLDLVEPSSSNPNRFGTATAGTATTITLKSGSSTTDSYYTGMTITIIGGTGANQSRVITGYVGSTLVATVDSAWGTTPDSTSQYVISSRFDGLKAKKALVITETNPVRFLVNGGTPTAGTGMIIYATSTAPGSIYLNGFNTVKSANFIDTATGASTNTITTFF